MGFFKVNQNKVNHQLDLIQDKLFGLMQISRDAHRGVSNLKALQGKLALSFRDYEKVFFKLSDLSAYPHNRAIATSARSLISGTVLPSQLSVSTVNNNLQSVVNKSDRLLHQLEVEIGRIEDLQNQLIKPRMLRGKSSETIIKDIELSVESIARKFLQLDQELLTAESTAILEKVHFDNATSDFRIGFEELRARLLYRH